MGTAQVTGRWAGGSWAVLPGAPQQIEAVKDTNTPTIATAFALFVTGSGGWQAGGAGVNSSGWGRII